MRLRTFMWRQNCARRLPPISKNNRQLSPCPANTEIIAKIRSEWNEFHGARPLGSLVLVVLFPQPSSVPAEWRFQCLPWYYLPLPPLNLSCVRFCTRLNRRQPHARHDRNSCAEREWPTGDIRARIIRTRPIRRQSTTHLTSKQRNQTSNHMQLDV